LVLVHQELDILLPLHQETLLYFLLLPLPAVVLVEQEIEPMVNQAVQVVVVFTVNLVDQEIHHQLHHLREILAARAPVEMVMVPVQVVAVVLVQLVLLEVTLEAAGQQLVAMVDPDVLFLFRVHQ
jgi:hypothetical protein